MTALTLLEELLEHLRREPSRTGSLVITIYGDAVVPRGGSLWLGTLIQILRGMGIEGGTVRTAMSRLAADGWLERTRIGRNSYYKLAEKGRSTFAAATARIYFAAGPRWEGRFQLAVLEDGGERGAQRSALELEGFGLVAPGVMVAPGKIVQGSGDGALLLEARADLATARRLAARAWQLERIAGGYHRFLARFSRLDRAVAAGEPMDELSALITRVLLIHEYRRVILRDPLLPEELLPSDWPGRLARALCGRIYRSLVPPSEHWLDRHGRSEAGPLPPPRSPFYDRFMDLPAPGRSISF